MYVSVLPYSSEVLKLISREIRLSQRNAEVDTHMFCSLYMRSVPVSVSETQLLFVKLHPVQAHLSIYMYFYFCVRGKYCTRSK